MKRFRWLLVLVLSLGIGNWLAPTRAASQASQAPTATPLPKGVQQVTSVEGITEYRLSNGLRVLLFPDPSKPTITVNITYLVGSAKENYGETGMAHLLEHLMFKGSPKHTNIPQELTEHGASPNGTTSYDRTNYFETFRATDDNLKWALDLESDRMVNSFIARKDLDTEMTVVRNEFEMGEDVDFAVLQERVMSAAYAWHNYGKSTIGTRSDIEKVPIERLQAFYRNWYQPDNAVLLVAGKFDAARTLEWINASFGPIPVPSRTLPTIYTQEPVQDGERSVTVRRVGDLQIAMAGYHVPAGSHPDYPAVDVLTSILGDSPSGRLYKALVDTRIASAIFNYGFQLRDPGFVIFEVDVSKGSSLDAARDQMRKTLDGVVSQPVTKEEVDRARQQLLTNIELNLNSSERVGLAISEWAAMGDWRLLYLYRDRLRKVTPDDVQRVAAAYLKPSNSTVGVYLPEPKPDRSEIPATPDAAEMLKGYTGEAPMALGEAFDSAPASIEARVKRSTLPNGLQTALLSKKTRGGTVAARMTFRFGDEQSLMNRSTQAELAALMLMRGTARHTREQIKDEFDRLKARVYIGGATTTSAFVNVETVRENLPATIRLIAEVLREPAFPEHEFVALKQETLAMTEEFMNMPDMIAMVTLQRHANPYPKGDVRYVATIEEEIEELKSATLADAKTFYTGFYGASNGQLAIVGDFDEAEVTRVIAETLGTWKSPRPFKRVPSLYHDVPALNRSLEAPDKAAAAIYAGQNLSIRDDDPDYAAMVLANYMLGGGFLNSRLATRVRQKEGLSYSVGSQFSADAFDTSGTFTIFATFAPQNLSRIETAIKEEMDRAVKDGFTAGELAAAKSGWLQSQQLGRANDAGLAFRLQNYLFLGRKLDWSAALEKKVTDLTPEQVSSALRKHIDPAKISIVKAGDFAKAATAKK